MNSGWIRLSRRLLDWQWHDEPNMVALWVHLLLRANYEPTKYHGMTIGAGQFVTTLKELSSSTGLSAMQVRFCLSRMVVDGAITISAKRRSHTIISIANFAQYQLRIVTKSHPHATSSKTDSCDTQPKQSQHYYNIIVTLKKHQKQHYYNKINPSATRSISDEYNTPPPPPQHYSNNNITLLQQTNKEYKKNNSSSPPSPARASESEIATDAVQATATEILSDAAYQPLILMRAKMTLEEALRAIPEFAAQCRCRQRHYKNRRELAEHLANWLQKRYGYTHPTQSATGRPDGQCAPTSGAAAANDAAAAEDERHRGVILRAYELMAGGS